MVKHIDLIVDDDLADKFEKAALQQGKSKTQLGKEYIEHGLECKKLETEPRLRHIQLAFSGNCKKCGKKVEAGEWAFWGGRGSGLIICEDCEVRKFGTKNQARSALKNSELQYTAFALKKEIAELVEKYKEANIHERMDALYNLVLTHEKQLPDLAKKIEEYRLRGCLKPEDEKPLIENLMRTVNENSSTNKEILNVIEDIKDFIMHPFRKKKKKAEVETETA